MKNFVYVPWLQDTTCVLENCFNKLYCLCLYFLLYCDMVIERLNYANYGLWCVQICFFILLHDVYSDKPTSLMNLELKDCLYEVLKNK